MVKYEGKNFFVNNKSLFENFFVPSIIVFSIFCLVFLGIFGSELSADWTCIFEGGYRIFKGQIPYRDFFMPVGPVVFFVQAFFDFLFGPNLFAMAVHSAFLSCVLAVFFYFLVKKYFNFFVSFLLAIAFHYCFNGIIVFPWYNQSALFFFLLNVIIICFFVFSHKEISKAIMFFSAVLCVLSLFSKQDVGLLHFFLLTLYFLVVERKSFRDVFVYFLLPYFVFVGFVFVGFNFVSNGNFSKWFNLGQKPHESRIRKIFSLEGSYSCLFSITFYFSLLGLYIFIKEKDDFVRKLSAIIIILSTIPTIVAFTSSDNIQPSFSGLPLILVLLFLIFEYKNSKLFKIKVLSQITLKNFAAILILLLLISSLSFIRFTRIQNYATPPYLQVSNFLGLNNNFKKINDGCFKGAVLHSETLENINILRKIIENYNFSFVNFDQYKLFYCDYNLTPPKNVVLWFDEGQTIFNDRRLNSYEMLLDYVKTNKPKVVFLKWLPSYRIRFKNSNFLEENFYNNLLNIGYENKYNLTFHYVKISDEVVKVLILKD